MGKIENNLQLAKFDKTVTKVARNITDAFVRSTIDTESLSRASMSSRRRGL
jgi:hypothetical protein